MGLLAFKLSSHSRPTATGIPEGGNQPTERCKRANLLNYAASTFVSYVVDFNVFWYQELSPRISSNSIVLHACCIQIS